ncbi:hypothetical protein XA68_10699 [Ophiocordyceps unilateralis]|uniref:Major facilitator superfamily (MFS) profile domain-containing protein n=1 Tax=Ophiocordyceps unilateralis TaxID=268505 RepID=A0A2A9NZ30_OPHUN|nr:hypothetical protein XA68_10699 [Ophiocordyceps unilateralis]
MSDPEPSSTSAPEPARSWASQSMTPAREALLVFTACMAQFCTQAAFMATLVLLHPIGDSFHIKSRPRLAWLVAGYSLAAGTLIIFCGRLGDIFGHGRMLVIGFGWFALWSSISGLSAYSTFELAIFARVMQGVGPAVTLPNALAVLGTAYPPGHRKAMVFALFGAVAPVGAIFGGVFASLLARLWWPWAWWVLALWLLFLAALAALAVPLRDRDKTDDEKEKEKSGRDIRGFKAFLYALDLPAAVVGVSALVLFNFAWTQAPVDGWGKPSVLVPLITGFGLFALFIFIEMKLSPSPLLPLDVLSVEVGFVLAAVLCGWASFGVWTLYLVQTLQDARQLSPLMLTAYFSPVAIAGAAAAVFTGLMLGPLRLGPSTVMMIALLAFTVGSLLTALAPVHQTYWAQIFVAVIVMPLGMDCSFPAATLIVSNAVARDHQGVGASLVSTVVNYGIALGVGFAGTVEMHVQGDPDTVDGRLRGFRGALFVAVGLAGLGLAVCLVFAARERLLRRGRGTVDGDEVALQEIQSCEKEMRAADATDGSFASPGSYQDGGGGAKRDAAATKTAIFC